MPCQSYGPDPENHEARRLKKRLDLATMLLCRVCRTGLLNEVLESDVELNKWWRAHAAQDKKRRQKEMQKERLESARVIALAKLTPADKVALGLIARKKE